MTCRLERDRSSPVATLILANAPQRNAFSAQLATDLNAVLTRVEADPTIRALVLIAEGPAFCVGGDVAAFADQVEAGRLVESVANDVAVFNPLIHRLASLPMPVVAGLNGAVAGGGLALAAACDLRVATSQTFFVPGFVRLGLPPDTGSSWLVTRLIGAARATDFLLRNRRIDANIALQWGLVNEIAIDVGARAAEIAAELATGPGAALAETKALLRSASANTLTEQLDAEEAAVIRSLLRGEIAEGVAAFVEKRSPRFGNRQV